MDPLKDVTQDLDITAIKERLSALESRVESYQRIAVILAATAGSALGIDLLPMLS